MTGQRPRRRWTGAARLAVGCALVFQVLAWTASEASAGTHAKKAATTTTAAPGTAKTATTLPPAPAGFAANLVTMYQAELTAARALGKTTGFESLATYKRQVANLNGPTLAAFFHVTQRVPHWNQVPALLQTIAAGARTPSSGSSSATLSSFIRAPSKAGANANAVLTGGPVGKFVPQSCPVAPSEASIFAAQIVIDVAYALFNGLVAASNISEFVSNFAAIFLGAVVADTVLLVALIVHDTLVYEEDLAVDCNNQNLDGQAANIDNTTIQSYSLMTSLMQLIVESQNTENATLQDVLDLKSQLGTVQQTLEQALTSSTQTVQASISGDNQAQSNEMQIIQAALQKDVTTIQTLQTTTGNEVVNGDTTIESSISTYQTQMLHEIDTDSQGLTALLTQDNQQITNALQSNFAATQGQYQSNLQVLIEQGLAGWGPVVPEVSLMTPVTQGGLLNATPIGVQEVVTADINALQAEGVKLKAAVLTDLAAANAALTAKQYTIAWTDYEDAYQLAA